MVCLVEKVGSSASSIKASAANGASCCTVLPLGLLISVLGGFRIDVGGGDGYSVSSGMSRVGSAFEGGNLRSSWPIKELRRSSSSCADGSYSEKQRSVQVCLRRGGAEILGWIGVESRSKTRSAIWKSCNIPNRLDAERLRLAVGQSDRHALRSRNWPVGSVQESQVTMVVLPLWGNRSKSCFLSASRWPGPSRPDPARFAAIRHRIARVTAHSSAALAPCPGSSEMR